MSSPIVPASFIQRVQTSFLMGLIVALILCGISIVQVFTYFERFPKDKKAIKAMVIVLCLFDCLATAMAIHTFHHNTIVTAGDIEAFLKLTWTFGVETVCITPIVLITQLFYAYQIFSYKLRRNFYVLGLLIALSLAAFGFGLYYHISTLNLNGNLTLLNVGAAFEVKNTIYQSIVTTTDILIVVLMCYLLRAANPTFKSSRTLIVKLILLVVGRGLLMSSVHIIVFILFLVRPAGFEWLAFHVLLPKVYFLSVLVSLNFRSRLKNVDTVNVGGGLSKMTFPQFAVSESSGSQTVEMVNELKTNDAAQDGSSEAASSIV